MPDYSETKIYTIVCYTTGKIYIGSTTMTLKERLRHHKYKRNTNCTSMEIIDNNNYNIVLVENYPCKNKKEAELREGMYIRNNPCVNIKIPGRTKKEWCQDNKEKMKEYKKEYYQDNEKKIKEKQKQYYEDNRERLNENDKQYYQNNKERLKDKRRQYHHYQKTWGGDPRSNNNLLRINIEIFK